MKFVEYNPIMANNCVVRTFSKLMNKEVIIIEKELIELMNEMNHESYTDIEVFEKYLEINCFYKIDDVDLNKKIGEFNLNNGKYSIFCYNKDSYYHMTAVINNVLYDKSDKTFELYPISIYKLKI